MSKRDGYFYDNTNQNENKNMFRHIVGWTISGTICQQLDWCVSLPSFDLIQCTVWFVEINTFKYSNENQNIRGSCHLLEGLFFLEMINNDLNNWRYIIGPVWIQTRCLADLKIEPRCGPTFFIILEMNDFLSGDARLAEASRPIWSKSLTARTTLAQTLMCAGTSVDKYKHDMHRCGRASKT